LVQIVLHAKRLSIVKSGHQARQGNRFAGALRALTGLITNGSQQQVKRGSIIGVKDRASDRAAAMLSIVLYANHRLIS
jgi:hypothetical protein